jgi:5'-3' exonuclease
MAPPGVEAEQLAADMQRRGAFDYVVSEDMDALTFGARRLLCKQTYEGFSCVDLDCLLATTGLTMPQFVDLCILCGTDFTERTVPRVGHVGAYDLVKQHGTIEAVLEARGHGDHLDGFDFAAARAQFTMAIPDDYAWLLDAILEAEQAAGAEAAGAEAAGAEAATGDPEDGDPEDGMWPDMPPEAIFIAA